MWFVAIVIIIPLALVAVSRWGVAVAALFMIVALGLAQYLGAAIAVTLFFGGWHFWGMPTGNDVSWPVAILRVVILLAKVMAVILFFMLSRWEETLSRGVDRHGRFPASASAAHRRLNTLPSTSRSATGFTTSPDKPRSRI